MRDELVARVFHMCDVNSDGWLDVEELGHFARLTGFRGDNNTWASTYTNLCKEWGWMMWQGLDQRSFAAWLDDATQVCVCSNETLQNILQDASKEPTKFGHHARELLPEEFAFRDRTAVKAKGNRNQRRASPKRSAVPNWAREPSSSSAASGMGAQLATDGPALRARCDLVATIFRLCDSRGEGRLRVEELKQLAKLLLWFDGDEAAWLKEYKALCAFCSAKVSDGLSLPMLLKLVDESSVQVDCFCTNRQLRCVVKRLELEAKAQGGPEDRDIPRSQEIASRDTSPRHEESGSRAVETTTSTQQAQRCAAQWFGSCSTFAPETDKERNSPETIAASSERTSGDPEEASKLNERIRAPERPEPSSGVCSNGRELVEPPLIPDNGVLRGAPSQWASQLDPVEESEEVPSAGNPVEVERLDIESMSDSESSEGCANEVCSTTNNMRGSSAFETTDTQAPKATIPDDSDKVELEIVSDSELSEVLDAANQLDIQHGTDSEASEVKLLSSSSSETGSSGTGEDEDEEEVEEEEEEEEEDDEQDERDVGTASTAIASATLNNLMLEVFLRLDSDKDGRLTDEQLRCFVEKLGFRPEKARRRTKGAEDDKGDLGSWRERCIAKACGGRPHAKPDDSLLLSWVVSHVSEEAGRKQTEGMLQEFLADLQKKEEAPRSVESEGSPKPKSQTVAGSREELQRMVFDELDKDCCGHLSCQQLYRFAAQTGFAGDSEDWEETWKVLLNSAHCQSSKKVDFAAFAHLLNDENPDTGCPHTDNELREVLGKLTLPVLKT